MIQSEEDQLRTCLPDREESRRQQQAMLTEELSVDLFGSNPHGDTDSTIDICMPSKKRRATLIVSAKEHNKPSHHSVNVLEVGTWKGQTNHTTGVIYKVKFMYHYKYLDIFVRGNVVMYSPN